jgi:hypothetical protein
LLLITAIIPALIPTADVNFARELGHVLYRLIHLALPTLLFVTLAFALFDFCLRQFHLLEKWSGDWDPRKLPSSERQANQVPRSSSIAGIIIESIFIVWWWNHGRIPDFVTTNAGAQVHFAPILATLHLPILIIAFIILAQHWINLVEPSWRWLSSATGMLTSIAALVIFYPLLHTVPLISVFDPNGMPISAREAAEIQSVLWWGVIILWLGILIAGGVYAWRLVYILWQTVPRTPMGSANGAAHV